MSDDVAASPAAALPALDPGDLTPADIVARLDRHVVGQAEAKRAVAIALRNRWRAARLPLALQKEVAPRNILMSGPTGVGKTEIARRLADLAAAPFVKVEATKFTEVGYHGRDVESMVRDLAAESVELLRRERRRGMARQVADAVERRLLGLVLPESDAPLADATRDRMREKLAAGDFDDQLVDLAVQQQQQLPELPGLGGSGEMEQLQQFFGGMLPQRSVQRRVTVAEARRILSDEEADRRLDETSLGDEAIARAEERGILFIDEIDKLCGDAKASAEVSRQGVQRDLLPLVEGTTVSTKWGPLRTDRVLFIAAGAFHNAEVDDLMPELQGRFPIRVELQGLTRDDLRRILTEPAGALTRQYAALLEVEGITLEWADSGLDRLAERAAKLNQKEQNLGARRLPALLEQVLAEISFEAPERHGERVTIDKRYVDASLPAR